jgi:MoaA/NifB/PqqE/SkfB family radical SAM enzyme
MKGLLGRASRYFDRTRDRIGTAPSGARTPETCQFGHSKLESIRSYGDFCRSGVFPAYPLEIFLEISNICDLKCAMCVQFSGLNVHRLDMIKGTARGFMDQGEISANLEQALKHALLVHCFGYGEPTIHPTFKSFLELVSRHEVMIDFFTNGMHLDEEFCQFLVDRRIYQITVSFSGATKETYESIYLGGDFERVLGSIKRLAEIKTAQKSAYPIIEVNSLGFQDHVATFDTFVSLMADHGVNVVMLKPLQSHKTIPELYEHVSIMRPGVESEVVKRGIKIGRRRGVQVNADLYAAQGATDDADYAQRMAAIEQEATEAFGLFSGNSRAFGANPVSRFGDIASELQPIRHSGKEKRDARVLSLDTPPLIARTLLEVQAPQDPGFAQAPFHCMEPFKTLYISRNGAAKPCCFANPEGWYLGDAKKESALAIWGGEGFTTTRRAIATGEYPLKSCEVCIRRKSGPRGHFTQHMLNSYLRWHEQIFGGFLSDLIGSEAPDALESIKAQAADIMERAVTAGSASTRAAPAAWPLGAPADDTAEFVQDQRAFLHRQLAASIAALPRSAPGQLAGAAHDFGRLLQACGRSHFRGEGSIVDLGLPSPLVQCLVTGLTAHPQADEITASFAQRREKLVERFELAAGGNDVANSDKWVKAFVGDATKIHWLATKPIELCLVQAGGRARPFQRAFSALLPYFIPGRTLVLQSDFYMQSSFHPKLTMGYLGDCFEWLGQAGLGAVFRFVEPARPEFAALDPYADFPADVCQRLHRQWHHLGLPRGVQLRLRLSFAQLLFETADREAALDEVDAVREEYADLLGTGAGVGNSYSKLLRRFEERFTARTRPATAA